MQFKGKNHFHTYGISIIEKDFSLFAIIKNKGYFWEVISNIDYISVIYGLWKIRYLLYMSQ
jgi:hypothetical protein